RGLHERRGRNAACDRLRLEIAGGTTDADLRREGRALAVGDDLTGEVGADRSQTPVERGVIGCRARDATYAGRQQHDGVVRGALAVDGDGVEALVDRAA